MPATRTRKLWIWEWVLKKCNDFNKEEHRWRRKDIHGRDYKINSAMILTVVFVERNAFFDCCKIKVDKGCDYVVVYRSKIRHMYCFYEEDIRCDRTVVLYFSPLSLLIWKMNNQWRLKLFNNVARVLRTSLSWIW